jgi:hypothetical protein
MKAFVRAIAVAGVVFAATAGLAAAGGARTAATAPSPTVAPSVSGSAVQGQSLSASSGSWTGTTPITFTYVWQTCNSIGAGCANIVGATAQTHTLSIDDVGHTLRVAVTARNVAGTAIADSATTAVVIGAVPPQNTALPQITGGSTIGSVLIAVHGTWTGSAPITFTDQWMRCDVSGGTCAAISGATASTYKLAAVDSGHTLRVLFSATNAGGSAQATSAATGVVVVGVPVIATFPSITGTTQDGQTLTLVPGTWTTPTTPTFAIVWDLCDSGGNNCSAIAGATVTTYKLTTADVGHEIRVQVTATNTAGSTPAISNGVGPVVAATAPPPTTTTTTTTTPTTTTAPTAPTGIVKLPNGEMSIPAASVTASDRLRFASIRLTPKTIKAKKPTTITFKIVDSNKYDVSGALVYVVGIPYGWAKASPESATAADGSVSITLTPTKKAPKKGSLVLYVRARTPTGDPLAGFATARLVTVALKP